MAPENSYEVNDEAKPVNSQAELDAFFAHIDLLRAENEANGKALIRRWMNPETQEKFDKLEKRTKEDLDFEDARLFQPQPLYLGVGAAIPSDFLASEAQSNNKALRNKFFPSSTLKASKARDSEEKAASAKRGLRVESSDEEEGRSGLGRAKKRKTSKSGGQVQDALVKAAQLSNPQRDTSKSTIVSASTGLRDLNQDLAAEVMIKAEREAVETKETNSVQNLSEAIAEFGKKKRKKSKRKHSKTGVELEEENTQHPTDKYDSESAVSKHTTESQFAETKANESKESELVASKQHFDLDRDLKNASQVTGIDHSKQSAMSKEERKKEKKARKEERRRLKKLEGDSESGISPRA